MTIKYINKIKENNETTIKNVDIEICPICGEKSVCRCKCLIGSRKCKNGHDWFIEDGNYYIGNGHETPGVLFNPSIHKK